MEPLDYLRILVGRWKIIAAALTVALAVGIAAVAVPREATRPHYTATATLLAEGVVPDLGSVAAIATSDRLIQRVRDQVAPAAEVDAVAKQVEATVSATPGILEVTARATTAEEASGLANAVAEELADAVEEKPQSEFRELQQNGKRQRAALERQRAALERQVAALERRFAGRIAGARSAIELRRLEVLLALRTSLLTRRIAAAEAQIADEQIPDESTGPDGTAPEEAGQLEILNRASAVRAGIPPPNRWLIKLTIAMLVGLVLGSALALIVENSDRRIRTPRQAESAFGYPILSELPRIAARNASRAGGSRYGALLRPLKIMMATAGAASTGSEPGQPSGTPGGSFLFTTPDARDGKTPVAASAAVAAAQLGHKAVLVAWDSEAAPLQDIVRREVPNGLGTALREPDTAGQNLQPTGVTGLSVLAGLKGDGTSAAETDIDRLLNALARDAGVVVIDGAPLLQSAETALLVQKVEAILIVVALGVTRERSAERAAEVLRRTRAPVVGLTVIASGY